MAYRRIGKHLARVNARIIISEAEHLTLLRIALKVLKQLCFEFLYEHLNDLSLLKWNPRYWQLSTHFKDAPLQEAVIWVVVSSGSFEHYYLATAEPRPTDTCQSHSSFVFASPIKVSCIDFKSKLPRWPSCSCRWGAAGGMDQCAVVWWTVTVTNGVSNCFLDP